MSRSNRAHIAKETIEIVDRGWYDVAGAGRVDLRAKVDACLDATVLIRPSDFERPSLRDVPNLYPTGFDVRNETTLSAARRLVVGSELERVMVLNFASAKNPGGGFLGGSQAQEESLARSSALYASLQTQLEYYEMNRTCRTALYTDHMILSPEVPVFRDDDGQLLAEPYVVGMLTAPAVNAGAVEDNEPANVANILPTMASRIAKVLAVAVRYGYAHLVLGAWGCGVFRNDPDAIAGLFAQALLGEGEFAGTFESVTFAVFDGTPGESIITPYRKRFSEGAL
ncbi:MAG: TIGR02452 family protein [Pirellulales bacterium]